MKYTSVNFTLEWSAKPGDGQENIEHVTELISDALSPKSTSGWARCWETYDSGLRIKLSRSTKLPSGFITRWSDRSTHSRTVMAAMPASSPVSWLRVSIDRDSLGEGRLS